jgi:hypothetical protein
MRRPTSEAQPSPYRRRVATSGGREEEQHMMAPSVGPFADVEIAYRREGVPSAERRRAREPDRPGLRVGRFGGTRWWRPRRAAREG